MMMSKKRAAQNHARKMDMFFRSADVSQDGWVDKSEFDRILKMPMVKHWLAAQELDASDADILFYHLDENHDERLCAMDLVQGVAKLKGAARNLDLFHMHNKQESLQSKLEASLVALHELVKDLHNQTKEHIDRNLSFDGEVGASDRRQSLL